MVVLVKREKKLLEVEGKEKNTLWSSLQENILNNKYCNIRWKYCVCPRTFSIFFLLVFTAARKNS